MLIMLYWDLILAGIDGFILGGSPLRSLRPLCRHACTRARAAARRAKADKDRQAGAGPENLSREASVRSATLRCYSQLSGYNFQLVIKANPPLPPKIQPP